MKEDKSSYRILLVDDNDENRILIKAYLKGSLHKIVEAENGLVAFEMVKNNEFDLVFMDMEMRYSMSIGNSTHSRMASICQ